MFSIPLFLRGWGRAISIVTHLGISGILMVVIIPGHWVRMRGYVFARRNTWKREIGVIPGGAGNRFQWIPSTRITVIIIPGHCIIIIPGHCIIIIPGH